MAQWSRADRTLYTKIVYYGPAFGGKTTNLETLHRITDPEGRHQLLSLETSTDRTIFFDLLPFDLGEILGYQVGVKLYTVPGQVRYDTTRQVVLAGADAVIFVADSSTARAEQNRWSLQNLQMNMRAKRLDPSGVPILYQFNKQDLADAASPQQVASWLGIQEKQGIPAIATDGVGVLESFIAGSRAMLQRIVSVADERTRAEIDTERLEAHIDRAFAPYLERVATVSAGGGFDDACELPRLPIVLDSDDLVADAVEASVTLAEKLTEEHARSRRLEAEAESLRRLVETLRTVDRRFEASAIADSILCAITETLPVPVASVLHWNGSSWVAERVLGRAEDPLLRSPQGSAWVAEWVGRGGSCITADLRDTVAEASGDGAAFAGLRTVAVVPVDTESKRVLVAYAADPDGIFRPEDERFMTTLAGHMAVGLEKAGLYAEQRRRGSELESQVSERTQELQRAYRDLQQLDRMKDRFLTNVSHEMRTPLTAILSATTVLEQYDTAQDERREMATTALAAAETLSGLVENLLRLAAIESGSDGLELERLDPVALLDAAIEICGQPAARISSEIAADHLLGDSVRLQRALANLIDNAAKFSRPDQPVEVIVEDADFARYGLPQPGVSISVLDRGQGIEAAELSRIFNPMEQGGEINTGKPQGMGLGLHEARLIVEHHGGRLDYLPREGGGSRFRILLPSAPAVSDPAIPS